MKDRLSFSKLSQKFGVNWVPHEISGLLDHVLGFRKLNYLYETSVVQTKINKKIKFFEAVLKELDVRVEVQPTEVEKIPRTGPLVVVANHPFGGIDGLALGSLLTKTRPDFKLLVNQELEVFDAMTPWLFKVDILSGHAAKSKNLKVLADCTRFLKDGNCIGFFPAGEVSSLHVKTRKIIDPEWSSHPVSLAKRTGAQILPVCFKGSNSLLFQMMGIIHPRFRTLLLARELNNKKGMELEMRIGEPISHSKICSFSSISEVSEYTRVCVEALKNDISPRKLTPHFFLGRKTKSPEPLILPVCQKKLKKEILSLPATSLLIQKGDFEIYCGKASQLPEVMKEISRLREKTFRQAGEGTGLPADSDRFDEWYYQLFAWDSKNGKIAGGYRLGVVDEIITQRGKSGMYAASEFSLKRGFYNSIGNAIEVGRSFITEEYQRKFSLLGLMWKGIGEFMNRHPKHFVLYGPVSISADYTQLSRNLIFRFLRTNRWSSQIARRTKAKNPFKPIQLSPPLANWVKQEGRTLDDLSAVISGVEPDKKGIPVLVKHYLKLKGSFVGFTVDSDFGNTLDGLIVVDIRNMEDNQLYHYFGKGGRERVEKSRNELNEKPVAETLTRDGLGAQVPFVGKHNSSPSASNP
jgi:putative hemolysin